MNQERAQQRIVASQEGKLSSPNILQRKCACGQQKQGSDECDSCKKGDSILQRKEKTYEATQSAVSAAPGRSSGQPLSPSLAQHFRPSLGSLIDRVRVHNDSSSSGFAHRQNAVAVASGINIYFARGAYQAGTTAGRNLIAHELAHVHQQHRSNGPPAGYRSTPADSYEREADRFAETGRLASDSSDANVTAKSVFQQRTAAEQIATTLRQAADGLGTDEEAIFNALTGRTAAEITDIKAAYLALSGDESLEAMLRDELSGDDLSNALSLLQGETSATETARRLWNAMRGLGTDEEAIYAAVAGRTAEQWTEIQTAYQAMSGNVLLADLRDELTNNEWEFLQSLLPGAEGGAVTDEDRATVIANQLEAAMAGLGTDEEAIYTALTGRNAAELREIEARFRLLTGFELDVRLRDELTDREYARAQLLLHPILDPVRIAMRLRDAVQGVGTDELEILAILTGRSPTELAQISADYRNLYGESLQARLRDELSGAEQSATETLRQQGVLPPEDEIKLAIEGPGTDEERLFAVLTEISANRLAITNAIDQYAAKGYGEMLTDIRDDLSGADLERALQLLHGLTPSGICGAEQRTEGLEAISGAVSLAQNAVGKLNTDIAATRLSSGVETALIENFNPGGAAGAVTLGLAGQVRTTLANTRTDMLSASDLTCGAPAPCVATPNCGQSFTYGWTTAALGATVRLCPAFFSCLDDPGRYRGMLHEFVHHTGVSNAHEVYKGTPGFNALTPIGDGSATDSLDHADTYASFAVQVR